MPKEPQPPVPPDDFTEEAIPFDDVVRRLLAAKPVPRKAPEPKAKPDEKPRDP
jgi:hypothetical protein